jgi:hypothetical protein
MYSSRILYDIIRRPVHDAALYQVADSTLPAQHGTLPCSTPTMSRKFSISSSLACRGSRIQGLLIILTIQQKQQATTMQRSTSPISSRSIVGMVGSAAGRPTETKQSRHPSCRQEKSRHSAHMTAWSSILTMCWRTLKHVQHGTAPKDPSMDASHTPLYSLQSRHCLLVMLPCAC